MTSHEDKIILGHGAEFSADSNVTGLNNNIIVVGGSGCGKTMSITEPGLLSTYNSSLIVPVTKRRLIMKYLPIFINRGYEVNILDLANPEKSTCGFDMMKNIKTEADITFLASSIVKSNPLKDRSYADPYWDDSAVSLLSAEIAKIVETQKTYSMRDLVDLHHRLDFNLSSGVMETSLDDEFDCLEAVNPNSFAVSCWKSFSKLPQKTLSCVYGTLNTAVDDLFTPEVCKLFLVRNQLNIRKVASKRTILFIITSAVNPSLNRFISIFYSYIFKELFEFGEESPNGRLPVPVRIICDDFATGGRILGFDEYISIFREKGISVTLLLQSESQLESMYGDTAATTIINNCDSYVYMGGMDIQSAKSVSMRLDAPVSDVLYMPVGQEFIFRRGIKPIVTKRFDTDRFINEHIDQLGGTENEHFQI